MPSETRGGQQPRFLQISNPSSLFSFPELRTIDGLSRRLGERKKPPTDSAHKKMTRQNILLPISVVSRPAVSTHLVRTWLSSYQRVRLFDMLHIITIYIYNIHATPQNKTL
mmetsp:Transcript_10397/g.24325  ORF Transcript_10397/g.24325 Transcript_10397/m.24325 type:complete len:111 (-) Transcript_10397:36-368(-)